MAKQRNCTAWQRPQSGGSPASSDRGWPTIVQRWRRRGRWLQRLWLLAMAIWLPLATPLALVSAQVQPGDLRGELRAAFGPLGAARAELPRERFDLDALALQLAFEEPADLIDHVRRHVRFEPYHGVLRGAEGALVSGAGNSYDQALLLARLLSSAGYDVEIWRANLDPQQTGQLLEQVHPASAEAPFLPPAVQLTEVAQAELASRVEQLSASLIEDVERFEALLLERVALGGDPLERVAAAAADYAFVVYRLGATEPWREAHPVWGSAGAPWGTLAVIERFEGEIPPELQHRLAFRVLVERRLGDELSVVPISDAWERPVANMFGVALTYTNFPDGLVPEDGAEVSLELLESFAADTAFFYPFFEEELPAGAKAFDLMGNVLEPDEAASTAARLFQTLAGNVAGAAGLLGGLGVAAPEPTGPVAALTAQWLEFELISPGGASLVHRRTVFDRMLPEARSEGRIAIDPSIEDNQVIAALATVHTFMVDTGRYSQDYLTDVRLALLAEQLAYADGLLEALTAGTAFDAPSSSSNALLERIAPLSLLQTFSAAPLPEGIISYRPAPALAVISQPLGGPASLVDVVANPRWSLSRAEGGLRFEAAATLRAGVWETRTEVLALHPRLAPQVVAMAAFADASQAAQLIPAGAGAEALAGHQLSLPTQVAVAEDLARGYAVVLPGSLSGSEWGWWRVDPLTGETLGRGGDGRGAAKTEYVQQLEQAFLVGGLFLAATRTLASCSVAGSGAAYACCVVENIILSAALYGTGLALAYFAVPAVLIFGALDIGVGTTAMVAGMLGVTVICGGVAGLCRVTSLL